jgi:hypothetical protein
MLLSVILVCRYRKKFSWTELFLYFFLLLEGMSSMRNIPIWIITGFFMTVKSITFLSKEASNHIDGSRRFRLAYAVYFLLLGSVFIFQAGLFFYGVYIRKEIPIAYPTKAVAYLHNHLPGQQIFSTYDWGDYLMWKLPEKKDFIDGRMPSWRWHANMKGESNYAFDEYKKVIAGQIPFSKFSAKYHITTLLLPKDAIAKPPDKFLGFSINKSWILQRLFFSLDSFYGVVKQAKKMGWRQVYSDQTAVIYEKR